jgi:hypothetical protein
MLLPGPIRASHMLATDVQVPGTSQAHQQRRLDCPCG